ncbi:MAG: hypothetical protein ACP5M4_11865 [Acidobacteriaceae bacterium]
MSGMTTVTLQTRLAGLALLIAGWFVLLFAVILLASPALRYVFVIAGLLVELLGLVMVSMHHRAETGGRA